VYERQNQISASTAESRASKILHGLGFSIDMQRRPTLSFRCVCVCVCVCVEEGKQRVCVYRGCGDGGLQCVFNLKCGVHQTNIHIIRVG
jgi:hypothetical protein